MKIILFANDSYFSFLLAKPLVDNYHEKMSLLVLSNKVHSSLSHIVRIFKKTSIEYFCYRSTVHALSVLNGLLKRRTVESLANLYAIKVLKLSSVNKNKEQILEYGPFDVGFAFNFDQVIGKEILDCCKLGVFNIHASKLPNDKGISPALWAFARGDKEIWSSIYKMDEGIDTGPIAEQFKIMVDNNTTAFSLYKKICIESGQRLLDVMRRSEDGEVILKPQDNKGDGTYWSWPNSYHTKLLKQNNRRLISLSDTLTILK